MNTATTVYLTDSLLTWFLSNAPVFGILFIVGCIAWKFFSWLILQFEKISHRFHLVEERFEKIDQRFEKIDQRFEKIDQRFEKLEHNLDMRFEKIDQNFAALRESILKIEARLDLNKTEFNELNRRTTKIENKIESLEKYQHELEIRISSVQS